MVGIRKTDVFQNSSGYGMFTGGLGFQYGAERLGALTVPAAAGNSKRQIKFITDFKTTALHAIPSYAIRLAEVFQEEGIDPTSTSLKTLVIGAEPHTDEQRRKIERMLGVKAYNSFGMTEMNGPGVAFECTEQDGMHFWEDCYLVEIINPETGDPVPEDEIGELMLGIALVEMKHYAHIRDAIVALGGTLPKPYDSKNVNIGETPVEALTLAAHSEVATIGFYKSVKERITASTPTADIARKLLTKLIADESLHLKLLTRQLKVMAGDDKKYDELMKKILD